MLFNKSDLQDIAGQDTPEGFEIVESPKIIDQGRWTTYYEMVFSYDGKYYKTSFGRGSTEGQEEWPYEYEKDEIECKEVHPVTKTITVYE